MVCGNFILPEPASYVFFYAFSNLRKLLYIIRKGCEPIGGKFKRKSARIKVSISCKTPRNHLISRLFMVDLKGFEPTTLRMRTHSGAQFVVLSSCFQPFRLESKWSCVLLCQMFPPVPETSVVSVVVIDQASPEYPARLDWYLRLDRSSGRRVFLSTFFLAILLRV